MHTDWCVTHDPRYNPKAKHIWDSDTRKWNGNLHGRRKAPQTDQHVLSFTQHPECEHFELIVFGSPDMTDSDNYSVPGYTTPAPPKPASYEPTVDFAADDAMDISDQEEYEAMDFDCMDAGAWLSSLLWVLCFMVACLTPVQ